MIIFAGLTERLQITRRVTGQLVGQGDSGGPLFIRGRLAGITSGGGVYSTEDGSMMSLSKYVDLNSTMSRRFLDEHLIEF